MASDLFLGLPAAGWLEAAAGLVMIVLTWMAVRKAGFTAGLALCTGAGLLVSHHAYVSDAFVLLPAALALGAGFETDWARYGNLLLLAPPLPLALLSGRPASVAMQSMILAYFVVAALALARRSSNAEPQERQAAA